ncbi:hypothetical protein [Nibricoccus sp. IMCC34717]|uniref:hypothetical protein n=1 Tax=Nibricoccus sp. IMCC34717 TaxID=3034021 RepID=UPI00385119A7
MTLDRAKSLTNACARLWFTLAGINPLIDGDVELVAGVSLAVLQSATEHVEAANAEAMATPGVKEIHCICEPRALLHVKMYADAAAKKKREQ